MTSVITVVVAQKQMENKTQSLLSAKAQLEEASLVDTVIIRNTRSQCVNELISVWPRTAAMVSQLP